MLLLSVSDAGAEYGIPAYCAEYPAIPLEDYPTLDSRALANSPSDYLWKQVHVVVCYTGINKPYGSIKINCTDLDGSVLDNLLFTVSPCSRVKKEVIDGLVHGDIIELYCMVESTLKSGKTIVMIEELFIRDIKK
jgi:hypothetical protein